MYTSWKNKKVQVELITAEIFFLAKAYEQYESVIGLFEKFDACFDDFKVFPRSKLEAEWMLQTYCKFCENKQPLPHWMTYYFHCSFSHVLNGCKVEKALRLTNLPHRPKESYVSERNQKIYSDIITSMANGSTLLEASFELSEKYNLHESNIQKIYSAVKKNNESVLEFQNWIDALDY